MAMGIWLPGGNGADLDAITAESGDVLEGKVILDGEGEPLAGTMPERGDWGSSELAAGASITVPEGHHGGGGKVTAKSLSAQTPGTAMAAQILSGKTAWVNGKEYTGTMPNRGDYNGWGNSKGNDAGNQRMWVKVPQGYYNENANVFLSWADIRNMAGITPQRIKKNEAILGIIGSFEGWVPTPQDLYYNGSFTIPIVCNSAFCVPENTRIRFVKAAEWVDNFNVMGFQGSIDVRSYTHLIFEGLINRYLSNRVLKLYVSDKGGDNPPPLASYEAYTTSASSIALDITQLITLSNVGVYMDNFAAGSYFTRIRLA